MQGGQGKHTQKGLHQGNKAQPPTSAQGCSPGKHAGFLFLFFFCMLPAPQLHFWGLAARSKFWSPACTQISPTWEGCLCASQKHTASTWVTPPQHQRRAATLSKLQLAATLANTLGCPSQQISISRQSHKTTTDIQNQKQLFLKITILSLA